MPPFLKASKIYMVPEQFEKGPQKLLDTLSELGVEFDQDQKETREIEGEDGVKVLMVEVKIPILVDMDDIYEITAIYGRPEQTGLMYRTDDQRVIDRPFTEMMELWQQIYGEAK